MAKSSTAILSACGEHYVAAYLSRFQLIVALPRAGVPGCDLLVASEKGGPAIRVQVKTGTQSTRTDKLEGPIYLWHTSFKACELKDPNLWFAYVWINNWPQDGKQPEVFFVPSKVVAATMTKCKADGDAEFFWMKVEDAAKYNGQNGLEPILKALGQVPASTS